MATFCGGYGKIMLGGKKVLRVGWDGVGKLGEGQQKKLVRLTFRNNTHHCAILTLPDIYCIHQ